MLEIVLLRLRTQNVKLTRRMFVGMISEAGGKIARVRIVKVSGGETRRMKGGGTIKRRGGGTIKRRGGETIKWRGGGKKSRIVVETRRKIVEERTKKIGEKINNRKNTGGKRLSLLLNITFELIYAILYF